MDPLPESVGQAFFAALEQGEWHRAAEFVHPEDRDMPMSRGPLDVLTLEWVDEAGWRVREFDFTGHGHGGWVTYAVPDEEDTAADVPLQ